jgi:hypothetical protein
MGDFLYNRASYHVSKNDVDLDSHVLKAMLLNSGYVPDASHNRTTDIVANEITGTGYTAGGLTLTGVAVTEASGVTKVDATDAQWGPGATITARYMVVYDFTANYLLTCFDFLVNKSVVNGTLTYEFDADGFMRFTNV